MSTLVYNMHNRPNWKTLHFKHVELLDKIYQTTDPAPYVSEAQHLLNELRTTAGIIEDKEQQRRLLFYAQNWSDFIAAQTDGNASPVLNAALSSPIIKVQPLPNNRVQLFHEEGEPSESLFIEPDLPMPTSIWRQDLLPLLKQRLLSGKNLALYGPSGIGKSTLIQILMRDKDLWNAFPDGMLWARLGRYPDTLALLTEWAIALGMPIKELASHGNVEELREAIRRRIGLRKILLVTDDANSSEDAFAFRCGGPYCVHLLSTDDAKIATDFAQDGMTAVPGLSTDDVVQILRQYAPEWTTANQNHLAHLIEYLNGLPLALTLLGRYLRTQNKPIITSDALLNLLDTQTSHRYTGTGIGTAQAAIWLQDSTLSQEAHDAVRACSVFPPKPNNFDVRAGCFVAGMVNDAEEVSEAFARVVTELVSAGLLEDCGSERYTFAKLISHCYQAIESNTEKDDLIKAKYRFIRFYVDYVQENRDKFQRLRAEFDNILAALNMAAELGVRREALGEESVQACRDLVQGVDALYHYLETNGLYAVAESQLRRASEAARLLLKTNDIQQSSDTVPRCTDEVALSRLLMYQAKIAEKRGQNSKAIEFLKNALAQLKAAYDDESRCLSSNLLSTMGVVQCNQGEYVEAQTSLLKAKEQAEHLSRVDEHQVSHCLMRLGVVETNRGKFGQAGKYDLEGLKRAHRIRHHEEVAGHLLNLGVLCELEGKYVRAERLLTKGLRKARLVNDREKIAGLLHALGEVAWKTKCYTLAYDYLEEAMTHARSIGHTWYVSLIHKELGEMYCAQSIYTEALTAFQKALEEAPTDDARAFAQWGLSKVQYHANRQEALRLGLTSYTILKSMQHHKARMVSAWLESNFDQDEYVQALSARAME